MVEINCFLLRISCLSYSTVVFTAKSSQWAHLSLAERRDRQELVLQETLFQKAMGVGIEGGSFRL